MQEKAMTKTQLLVLDTIESRARFERWCNVTQKSVPARGTIWAAFYEGGDLHIAVVTPSKGLTREEVARG